MNLKPKDLRPLAEVIVDTSHLWVLDGKLVIRGIVVTSAEAMDLPFRDKKLHEPATQNAIAREIERVLAWYVPGTNQAPHEFEGATKLYIREDIR